MIVSDKLTFVPAPEGMHNAVCVDIVDLGEVDTQWGKKARIRIVWELPEVKMEDGRPFLISNFYLPSLNEKANLRKHLQSWRGKAFSQEELRGFDLETVIGKCCQILVVHNYDDGKCYANIAAITKAQKQVSPLGTYVRVKDRPTNNADQKPSNSNQNEGSDLPF